MVQRERSCAGRTAAEVFMITTPESHRKANALRCAALSCVIGSLERWQQPQYGWNRGAFFSFIPIFGVGL